MEEGRVADGRDHGRLQPAVDVPLRQAHTRPHRHLVPHRLEGVIHPQDGAADVSGHHHLALAQLQVPQCLVDGHIGPAVGTTGADRDRACRRQLLRALNLVKDLIGQEQVEPLGHSPHHLLDPILTHPFQRTVDLPDDASLEPDVAGLHNRPLLDVRLQLLQHYHVVAVRQQGAHLRRRERVRHPQREQRHPIQLCPVPRHDSQGLGEVRRHDAGSDKPHPARLLGQPQLVQPHGAGEVTRRITRPPQPLDRLPVLRLGDGRPGFRILRDVPLQDRLPLLGGHGILHVHRRVRVRDRRHRADEDGAPTPLRELEGQRNDGIRLGHRRRFEHRHIHHPRVSPRVLLHHARMRPRIIGHVDHQPTVDAGVRQGIEGVRGHVDARHLHRAHRPLSGPGRPARDLDGHLLVGAPLHVPGLVQLHRHQTPQRARRRRAGIPGHHLHPGPQRPQCNRLIARDQPHRQSSTSLKDSYHETHQGH